jgi:hypothetical protein
MIGELTPRRWMVSVVLDACPEAAVCEGKADW